MNGKDESRGMRALKKAGWLLVAASLAFIAVRIARTPQGSLVRFITPAILVVAALCSLAYSLLNVLLAYCWARAAGTVSNAAAIPALIRIHLRTGIVKYLPGNIFHLAGRHALAGEAGAEQGTVLAANIIEMGTIVAAAVALVAATAGTGQLDPAIAHVRGMFGTRSTVIVVLMLAAACAAGIWVAMRYRALLDVSRFRTLVFLFFCYLVFFTAASLLLYLLCVRVTSPGVPVAGYGAVLGVFSLSWIAGFVVPGAPGGLGIRESVMVVALSPAMGGDAALAAALLLRAVTVAGDALSFGFSFPGRKG